MVRAQVCHLHAGQILNHKERGLAGRHWCGENVSGCSGLWRGNSCRMGASTIGASFMVLWIPSSASWHGK